MKYDKSVNTVFGDGTAWYWEVKRITNGDAAVKNMQVTVVAELMSEDYADSKVEKDDK
mgnify:CR=1 FL=1